MPSYSTVARLAAARGSQIESRAIPCWLQLAIMLARVRDRVAAPKGPPESKSSIKPLASARGKPWLLPRSKLHETTTNSIKSGVTPHRESLGMTLVCIRAVVMSSPAARYGLMALLSGSL